jgi:hypothetical protein
MKVVEKNCPLCYSKDCLERLPPSFRIVKKAEKDHKVGSIVEADILEAKQKLKEEKERLKKQEYTP